MSARYFCDMCFRELPGGTPDRVRRRLGDVTIEVMIRFKNTWNAGQLCEECVLRVVREGESAGRDESYVATS